MDSLFKKLSGNKTYIVAFVGAGIALLQAFGVTVPIEHVPDWVWRLLEFAGLGALRAGVAKANNA